MVSPITLSSENAQSHERESRASSRQWPRRPPCLRVAARGSAGREDRAAGSCLLNGATVRLLLRDLLARPAALSRGTFAVWTPAPHCFVLHGRRHPSQPAAGSDSAVGNGPPAVSAPHRGGSRGAGPCGGFPRRRGRTHSYKCPGHFTSASKVAVCPRVPTSPAWRKPGA